MNKIAIFTIYVFFCVYGLFNLFSPTLLSGFERTQPDQGDAMFNAVMLEHVFRVFFDSEYKGTFFSPIFFYPYKYVLTFSDHHLGSAPIYILFRFFATPLTAFQLWEIVICILTYVAYVFFLRELKINKLLTAFLAFAFTFGTAKVLSSSHPQMYPQFYTPIFWIFFWRFLKQPNLKDFTIYMLMVYMQFLASYYLGWYLLFSVCVFVFVYGFVDKDALYRVFKFVGGNYKKLAILTAVFGVFYAIVWGPYVVTGFKFKHDQEKMIFMDELPVPEDYLRFPAGGVYDSFLYGYTPQKRQGMNENMFLGLFGLVALLSGVKLFFVKGNGNDAKLKLAKTFYLVFLMLSILSLRIGDKSLWYYVYFAFPGSEGVRYTHRIWSISYFYLFAGFGLAAGYLGLSKKFYFPLLIMLFVIEQTIIQKPSIEKARFDNLVNDIVYALDDRRCDVFYFKPLPNVTDNFPMLLAGIRASMELNVPVVNGYSGFSYGILADEIPLDDLRTLLQKDNFYGRLCHLTFTNPVPEMPERQITVSEYILE